MLKLASIFTDGAVLQRNKLIPVWGQATPDELVEITFNGQSAYARTAFGGKFMCYLPSFPAGGPYEMTVKCGNDTLVLKDIMVGEVWLASGQSNMSYALGTDWTNQTTTSPGVNQQQLEDFINTLEEKKAFRVFTVPKKLSATKEDSIDAVWRQAKKDAATVGTFSAVAAWFGRYIQEGLEDVPIGLIDSSWGGTRAESWTSTEALFRNPLTYEQALQHMTSYSDKAMLERAPASSASMEELLKDVLDLDALYGPNRGLENGWANPGFDDDAWENIVIPGSWIRQNITDNGIVWVRIPVEIPEKWVGKELTLNLGNIDKTDITYFNGTEVGKTGGKLDVSCWNLPRQYTIPAELVKAGRNVIAIRALSFYADGSLSGTKPMYNLQCPELNEQIEIHGTHKIKPELNIGKIQISIPLKPNLSNPNVPGVLFDSMIYPLIPYAIRGAIWYQGESNGDAKETYYESVLSNMISDWRFRFCQGDFPFIQVELANYREPKSYDADSYWANLRNQQNKVCKLMKNVYLISTIDIGDPCDIHPQDKKSVGKRLADNALCNVYGKNGIVPNGPMIRKAVNEGNSVRLIFDYADGMYFPNGSPEGLGFFISGGYDVFVPVDNVIMDGNSLIVSSKKVQTPKKVCYSWADNPDGNLRNGAKLPAHPFMIDTEY